MITIIEAKQLTKRVGAKQILHGIDLSLQSGQFLTIFGPNGAGKTTLLKILSLLTSPTSGSLMIAGQEVADNAADLRKQIGVISHHSYLYGNLTARENLLFYGRMYQVPDLEQRIEEVLSEVGLGMFFNDPVRIFSRGMLQRLSIARAILHNPRILFLDEPYTGLDLQAIEILNSVLAGLKDQQRTVVMITHTFDVGLALSDEVLIINKGRVAFHGARSEVGSLEEFQDLYREKVGGRN